MAIDHPASDDLLPHAWCDADDLPYSFDSSAPETDRWRLDATWRFVRYLPLRHRPSYTDPHYMLFVALYRFGPLTWDDVLVVLGPGSKYGFAEIRLRRARRRAHLHAHWLALGACEWWLPDAVPNPLPSGRQTATSPGEPGEQTDRS
jgi:hypothetical protein